jgi:hypothetical protein
MRNSGNSWEEVSFMPSSAPGGNSSIILSYSFIDNNSNRGITQYRIRQIDLDGKTKYSNIISVRGEKQKGKIIVYPNPSPDGNVNIVLEEKRETRNISLTDMNGRIIRQWNKVTNNTIQIFNLNPGMYMIQVISVETGLSTMEKIIVAK